MCTSPRPSRRIDCQTHCILDHEGVAYSGVIENVSLSGTLIRLQDPHPDIKAGDACGLMVSDSPDVPHLIHSCRVIRLDPPNIGLELLELGCG